MGSPLSPIVANIFMEKFEEEALAQHHTPQVCGRGMWMILLSSKKKSTVMSFFNTSTH